MGRRSNGEALSEVNDDTQKSCLNPVQQEVSCVFDRVIEAAEAVTKTDKSASPKVEYHLGRARSERDRAYRATDARVSDAHMRLSVLHLQRALMLQARQPAQTGDPQLIPSMTDETEPPAPWLQILELPRTR